MGALDIPDGVLRLAGRFGADAAELLTGRAALRGIAPHGQVSAGGATRLVPTTDGWCALTLSRDDDVTAVPALLAAEHVDEPWPAIAAWAAARSAAEVVERGRLLGLPVARLGETRSAEPRVRRCGTPGSPPADLLVVDLTSMWAGPLCGQLLARSGATVVKVESPTRPDGTRRGDPDFFGWMNAGKLSYTADFERDHARLQRLLAVADVVLEGSRPAALDRRGLGPDQVPVRPGRVWLRITGHGTHQGDRVAFGDDAAVAGGLVRYRGGAPEFIGDALADPITGVEAAAAVHDSLRRGGGELIEIALAEVAATYARLPALPNTPAAPSQPAVVGQGPLLGADNAAVDRLVDRRC